MGRRGRSRSRSYDDDHRSRSGSPRRDNEELRAFWAPVKDDPHDFNAWVRLLDFVEQKGDSSIAEEAFDAFLKRYPFCFGYWRKYAELERRNHKYERALTVYERGVKAIPLSVDLWLSYIAYIKDIGAGQKQAIPKIRTIYMRALDACGLDFRSDKLWSQYIDWEISVNDPIRASQVYDIVLVTPTAGYLSHFERYKQFIELYEPDQILGAQEYDAISDVVFERIKDELNGAPMFFMTDVETIIPEEEVGEDGIHKRLISRRTHTDVAAAAFRAEILERRRKLHHANEEAVNDRLKFENAIKRPYFHVKPLEREQLANWYNYLDFEIREGKKKRIQVLFDRCIIACAFYEEMWIKYAAYYDSCGETERARDLYQQASEIHCSRKPGIFLAFSAFEEKHGDTSAALSVLNDFDRRHPGYVAIALRKVNIERRHATKQGKADYSSAISKLEKLINEPNSRRVKSFYSLKLARLYAKVCREKKLAKQVIKDAISRDKDNLQLYMALVDIAFSSSHYRESDVISAFDYAIESRHLTLEQRFLFSQRKLDFLEELGTDPGALQDHFVVHSKLEKQLEEPAPTLFSNLKRKTPSSGDEPTEKRPYEMTTAPMAGDANGMAQVNASPVVWATTPDVNQQPQQQAQMASYIAG